MRGGADPHPGRRAVLAPAAPVSQAPAQDPLAGTYGIRRGVPRLLELLDAYTLPAAWFVPEHTALRQPGAVRRIAAAGHEIAAAAPPPPPPPPGPRSAPTRSTACPPPPGRCGRRQASRRPPRDRRDPDPEPHPVDRTSQSSQGGTSCTRS
ncbi:polysaccharide deacetylase family protein [Streptomyces antimycoticus]|uniref:polysaccharide deacetylase family protein n=2 Tax=Streptomyces TaxID=1883 RepID=UPI0036EF9011